MMRFAASGEPSPALLGPSALASSHQHVICRINLNGERARAARVSPLSGGGAWMFLAVDLPKVPLFVLSG